MFAELIGGLLSGVLMWLPMSQDEGERQAFAGSFLVFQENLPLSERGNVGPPEDVANFVGSAPA